MTCALTMTGWLPTRRLMPDHSPLYDILREAFEAGERIAFHPDGPTAGSELAALAARMEEEVEKLVADRVRELKQDSDIQQGTIAELEYHKQQLQQSLSDMGPVRQQLLQRIAQLESELHKDGSRQ